MPFRSWLFLLLTVATLDFFYFRAGFDGQVPGFRDAWHFYYPLLSSIESMPLSERLVPGYQPADGFGSNLVGEGTTAVFYPLRILLLLPVGSLEQRMTFFMWMHCVMAAAFSTSAALRIGCSSRPAVLAGFSFGLSAPVLFQHVNLPFLIGAAWTPLALAEILLLAEITRVDSPCSMPDRRPSIIRFVTAAVCMLLGGDIQACAHAFILAAVVISVSLLRRRWKNVASQATWILCSLLLTATLSAIQLVPSYLWFAQSHRFAAVTEAAGKDLYDELPDDSPFRAPGRLDEVLRRRNTPNAASSRHYDFSIAPWHLLTLPWPFLEGSFFPEHSRWIAGLRAEPRMWLPSLSFGFVPFLVLCATLLRRRRERNPSTSAARPPHQRMLCLVLVVSGTAMMGNFGPVWMIRNVLLAIGATGVIERLPQDDFATTSWLFNHVIPFYSSFRFPAKWCIWFTCAISLLTAIQVESWELESMRKRLRRVAAVFWLISLMLTIGAFLITDESSKQSALHPLHAKWESYLRTVPDDAWMGSLSLDASARAVLLSGITAVVLSSWVLVFASRSETIRRFQGAILFGTALEFAVIGPCWFAFVTPKIAMMDRVADKSPFGQPERIWANNSQADFASDQPHGNRSAGPSRAPSVVMYQDRFRLGKLHLLHEQWSIGAIMTAAPRVQSLVRSYLAETDRMRIADSDLSSELAWLGVTHRLVRTSEPTLGDEPRQQRLLTWYPVSADTRRAPSGFVQLIPMSEFKPKHVRPDQQTSSASQEPPQGAAPADPSIEPLHAERNRYQWIVHANEPTLMLVRQYQDGGWTATAGDIWSSPPTAASTAVRRYAGVFQAIELPQGRSFVALEYRTPGLEVGSWISMLTAMTAVSIGAIRLTGKRFSRRKPD